jgi:hypothetical protein
MGEVALEVPFSEHFGVLLPAIPVVEHTHLSSGDGSIGPPEAAILRNPPSDLVQAVTLVTCFQKVSIWNPGRDRDYPG